MPAVAQTRPIKLGYVSPQTGPLAAFAEADNFIIANFKEAAKAGIKLGNATVPIEVVVKDSQSNPNRAAQVAKDLIVQDKIDLMLVASTPETTNPVSAQCEIEEVPCISTMAPWQPVHRPPPIRPADHRRGRPSATPLLLGLEDVIAVFTNMWSQVPTDKSVAALPNDGDGNAWATSRLVSAGAGKSRLQAHRSRPLPEPHRQFLGADQRVQNIRPKSSPAWCCRPISPHSGQALQQDFRPRSPRSARSCSRSRSRRWADGSNLSSECGGRQTLRSSLTGMGAKDPPPAMKPRPKTMDPADRLRACAVRGCRRCPSERRGAMPACRGDRRPIRLPWSAKCSGTEPTWRHSKRRRHLVGGQWRWLA